METIGISLNFVLSYSFLFLFSWLVDLVDELVKFLYENANYAYILI